MSKESGGGTVVAEMMATLGIKVDESSLEAAKKILKDAVKNVDFTEAIKESVDLAAKQTEKEQKVLSEGAKNKADWAGNTSERLNGIAETGLKLLTGISSMISSVFSVILDASPVLKAVQTLFNLAMRMFFMPIGNALGQELIPAVVGMIEEAMSFWDVVKDIEDKGGLSGLLEAAIDYLIPMLENWFYSIGTQLQSSGGLLGSIGTALVTLSGVISLLPTLLDLLVNATSFILEHLKEVIGLIVAFKAASLAMQVAQLAATIAAAGAKGVLAAGAVASVTAGGAYLVSDAIGDVVTNNSTGVTNYYTITEYGKSRKQQNDANYEGVNDQANKKATS